MTSSTEPLAVTSIDLTHQEARLRDLLLDVSSYIDSSSESKEHLELRFAGGWVRDKLLGIPSHDIDTAINSMTGSAFTQKMMAYLENPENLQKHGIQPDDVGNLYKIAANPEKSKHLETVTTKLFGIDLDFVNLRKETYSEDSRNPQMEFGTAEEDAIRRDATINALFYNIHTGKVEDFTGGLEDMDRKLIRTPLEPYQTFADDPLRVLRLIRFASRLGFDIDPNAETFMGDVAIMQALKVKISRERVGVEVEKMLRGRDPRSSLRLFDRLGLYSTVFTDPTAQEIALPKTGTWSLAYDCLHSLLSNESPGSVNKSLIRSEDELYLAWILASLAPWIGLTTAFKKYTIPAATAVAREGIKMNNHICDVVTGAFQNYEDIMNYKTAFEDGKSFANERDNIGMAIRRWDKTGGHWRLQIVLAILVQGMQSQVPSAFDVIFHGWQQFLDHLSDIDVMNATSLKRVIDGTQLSRALGTKPGKWMTSALDVCMEWQLRNPGVTDPLGAVEEVRSRKEELKIPIA